MMYEKTGLCPFVKTCESHQKIIAIENQIIRERREFLTNNDAESNDFDRILKEFFTEKQNVRRSAQRCYENFKSCLRYWQRLKSEVVSPDPSLSNIQEIHTHRNTRE